ncbi:MAG: hypothetical protein U0670_23925 [Anaerolineae bacterium]
MRVNVTGDTPPLTPSCAGSKLTVIVMLPVVGVDVQTDCVCARCYLPQV